MINHKIIILSFALLLVFLSGLNAQAGQTNGTNTNPTIVEKAITNTQQQQSARRVLTPNQQLTAVYAAHALTGLCAQDTMTKTADSNWTAQDRSTFWKKYQDACRCVANEILSVADPADVVDFARTNYADESATTKIPTNETRMDAIAVLYTSSTVRQKCGLPE